MYTNDIFNPTAPESRIDSFNMDLNFKSVGEILKTNEIKTFQQYFPVMRFVLH